VKIPFASTAHASTAKQVIEVDKELQPHAVQRTLEVADNTLIAYVLGLSPFFHPFLLLLLTHLIIKFYRTFETMTIRLSRITVNAFLENVDLVVRTLAEFGDDAASIPAHP
jgi:EKC/KEOPS complex subunit PCC1/LAGE3